MSRLPPRPSPSRRKRRPRAPQRGQRTSADNRRSAISYLIKGGLGLATGVGVFTFMSFAHAFNMGLVFVGVAALGAGSVLFLAGLIQLLTGFNLIGLLTKKL